VDQQSLDFFPDHVASSDPDFQFAAARRRKRLAVCRNFDSNRLDAWLEKSVSEKICKEEISRRVRGKTIRGQKILRHRKLTLSSEPGSSPIIHTKTRLLMDHRIQFRV
jgi:hypothetical protein